MASSAPAQPLRGRAVLVTRSTRQAEKLAWLIGEAGGEAVLFAALAIESPADPAPVRQVLAGLASFDLGVFVSSNAVEHGLALLGGAWPAEVPAAAVGEGTAATLRQHGIASVIVAPGGADSESLLATPQLKSLRGKRVLILRGEGGREVLADQLRQRGAEVAYAECYRRLRPRTDPAALIARWEQGGLHAVTVMSGETLDNLWGMLGSRGRPLLRATPLFVPHANIAQRAAGLDLTEVAITPPGDEGVLRGLSAWFSLHAR
ncbi:MAG TPA: uroporphyrinogen-III synthase [Burkholderiales bacterium]|nr:uroporphyrinogen-III synthase [Burkholderiales bacterium]